jgi:hypothetical protein
MVVMTTFFYSCSKGENKSTVKDSNVKDTAVKDASGKKEGVQENVKKPKLKKEMLEGLWISDSDPKFSIRVKAFSWTETYEGETPEIFKFGQSDSCMAFSGEKKNPDGNYITVFDPDGNRCFYIVKLNETKLELSYVGRGNTEIYTRKKE